MSTLKVNTLQNTSGVEVYTAKAWVNFNGTGTVAIRASGNISSITDNGTGDYTVNFTNALADANYALTGTANLGSNSSFCTIIAPAQAGSPFTATPTTTSCRFVSAGNGGSGGAQDPTFASISVFR